MVWVGNRIMDFLVKPEWEMIEGARNAITDYCVESGLTTQHIEATVMVASELSENAIKYGVFRPDVSEVKVIVTMGSGNITIEVINPVGPESFDHLEELDRTIQWIRSFQDPFEAYTQRLIRISQETPSNRTNGLGLARIAYEAQAVLDFFVDESDMLNVSAICNRTEEV